MPRYASHARARLQRVAPCQVALAKNYVSNSRTKHIERRHLKIRELVEEMMVRPEFVPTDENPADLMSKPLGRAKFEKFRRIVLNHEV